MVSNEGKVYKAGWTKNCGGHIQTPEVVQGFEKVRLLSATKRSFVAVTE